MKYSMLVKIIINIVHDASSGYLISSVRFLCSKLTINKNVLLNIFYLITLQHPSFSDFWLPGPLLSTCPQLERTAMRNKYRPVCFPVNSKQMKENHFLTMRQFSI